MKEIVGLGVIIFYPKEKPSNNKIYSPTKYENCKKTCLHVMKCVV